MCGVVVVFGVTSCNKQTTRIGRDPRLYVTGAASEPYEVCKY